MRRLLPSILVSAVLFALVACTAQPLYAPDPTSGTFSDLNVAIDNPDNRESQLVRNALLELAGVADGTGAYSGKIDARIVKQTIFQSDAPDTVTALTNRRITLTATLTLSDASTGDKVTEFTAIGRTFFESSRQQFANGRAEIDANRRAAAQAAESLRNQVAAYVRRNPIPVGFANNG